MQFLKLIFMQFLKSFILDFNIVMLKFLCYCILLQVQSWYLTIYGIEVTLVSVILPHIDGIDYILL